MKSNNKNNFFVRLGVICAIFLAIIFSSNVFADYEWATGGHAGTGGPGNSSGNGYYDCYSVKRCPRWILVPLNVYQQIKSQNRIVGSYTSLPSCENDKYLMIAGNQRDDGTLQIYNLNSGDRPLPYKEYHTYTSIASSISSVTNNVDWDNPDSTSFFSRRNDNGVKGDDGHVLTYKEVLNEIIKRSGASEKNIAVACPSMVETIYTLKATPKDIDSGATLPYFDSGAIWSADARKDKSAMVDAGYDSSQGYEFIGWKENLSDSTLSTTNANHTINGDKYTENKMTGNKEVFAMYRKARVLTVEGKNIHDNSDVNEGDQSKSGSGVVTVERNIVNKYHFIGWKENPSIGLGDILDSTDTSKNVYVSDGGKYKYNNSSKNIYLKINANVANGNKTVYAYYTPSCELRIDRGEGATITIERTSSKYGNQHSVETWSGDNDPTPWTLYKDDELKVTFGAKSGYNLSGAYISGIPVKSGVSYTVPGDSSGVCDVTVSVDAKKNEFEGRSRVGGDMSVSTGWTKTSDTKTYVIDNCDPLNGCEVKFDHSLRRTGGVGSVNYSITRTYFGDDTENLKSNQSIDPGDETIVRNQNDSRIILRPGQVVCEEMKFKSNAAGSDTVLKVCAVASGSAQGDAQLLLDMKISKEKDKNGEYINYTDEIYVKPGDDIRYRAVYHPVLQYTYGIKPQKIEINGDLFNNPANSEHGCMLSNYYDLGGFFGNCQKDFWKNAFTMYSKMNPSSRSVYAEKDYEYSAGDTSEQREFRDKKVGNDDVGNELIGYAEINKNNNIRATPTSITFSYKDGYSVATVNVDRINKTAKAVVPYNFTNSIEIATDGNIVYAGETAKITSTVAVNPKTNSLTTDGSEAQKYATKVPEAKVKLKLRYGNGEEYEIEKTKTNFSNSALYDMTVNIKDFPAGTTIKAQACVYPASSGADGNWQDKEGSHDWACSAEKEYIVAKRPSFQVWGGGVYSNGGITAPSSIKNNLDGVYAYNVNSSSGTTVFGSWAEQAVVSNGAVNGLASGAATGLNITLNGMLVNGGIVEKAGTDFCDNRVPLSFANYLSGGGGCPYQPQTGQLGAANNALDRRALINYIIGNTGAEVIKLQSSDGNYILDNRSEYGGDIVGQGITRVVVAASTNEDGSSGAIVPGTITIVSNKYYESYDEPHYYSTLTEIPKLIIYAENINIACNVTRLDAILIAEDTITTCPSIKKNDEGELMPLNEPGNSTPLTVNGIVIANKLELNRTYGAATGVNSGVPAEIVNHDSSTVLWSMSQVDTDDYSGLSIIYQHELAPRY